MLCIIKTKLFKSFLRSKVDLIKDSLLILRHLISYIVSLRLPVYVHSAAYLIISNLHGFGLWAKLSRSSAMHQLRLYFVHGRYRC